MNRNRIATANIRYEQFVYVLILMMCNIVNGLRDSIKNNDLMPINYKPILNTQYIITDYSF